jgi:hypothetical protein
VEAGDEGLVVIAGVGEEQSYRHSARTMIIADARFGRASLLPCNTSLKRKDRLPAVLFHNRTVFELLAPGA